MLPERNFEPQFEFLNAYKKFNANTNIYNQFHKVLRLFDALPNFSFTTSETMAIITYKYGIYELPHKLPNDLRLKILGN